MSWKDQGFEISLANTIRTAISQARRLHRRLGEVNDGQMQTAFESWFESENRRFSNLRGYPLPKRDHTRARAVFTQYFKKELARQQRLASDDGPKEG